MIKTLCFLIFLKLNILNSEGYDYIFRTTLDILYFFPSNAPEYLKSFSVFELKSIDTFNINFSTRFEIVKNGYILTDLKDTLKIKFSEKPSKLLILHPKKNIRILIIYSGIIPMLNESYIKQNSGKIIIETPDVFELANICFAITDYGLKSNVRVFKKNIYYEKMKRKFIKFKKHPLIVKLDSIFNSLKEEEKVGVYVLWRGISYFYYLENTKIKQKENFKLIGKYSLNEYENLLNDFIEKSNFLTFYKENKKYFEKLKEKYISIDIYKMKRWLEDKLNKKIDCIKIIFSPLIYATHNVWTIETDRYTEILVFLPNPDIIKNLKEPLDIKKAILERIVFTEIDHPYTHDLLNKYREEINGIFKDIDFWYNSEIKYYPSSFSIFAEYFTWSLYVLYAYENYPEDIFKKIKEKVENNMIKNRRFIKFKEFDEKFIELYKSMKFKKIEELMPYILDFCKKIYREDNK